jgi:uncharacterized protein
MGGRPVGRRGSYPRCVPTVLRLHGDLRALARPNGAGELRVTSAGPRSVKDLVESVGVPHTEVGHLTVDGVPVGFAHRVDGHERVDAYPASVRPHPEPSVLPADPPRAFVCDVHLGTLARRLRLLGFDTWYANDADDVTLIEVAVDEGRVLLSRDRGLLSRRVVVHGYLPRSDDPAEQLTEVVRRFDLAGAAAPLTRCVRCNDVLDPVDAAIVAAEIPPRSHRAFDRFARCRGCGQVYWPGSHLDALADTLRLATDGPDDLDGTSAGD